MWVGSVGGIGGWNGGWVGSVGGIGGWGQWVEWWVGGVGFGLWESGLMRW